MKLDSFIYKTIIVAVMAIAATCCVQKLPTPSILKENEYAIAGVNGALVICMQAHRTNCGIRLKLCQDFNSYECVSDVKVFNIDNIFKAYGVQE
jgi:hypothetical protein